MSVNLCCAVVHPQVLACTLPSEKRGHTARQGLLQAGEQSSHRFLMSPICKPLSAISTVSPRNRHLPRAEAAPICRFLLSPTRVL